MKHLKKICNIFLFLLLIILSSCSISNKNAWAHLKEEKMTSNNDEEMVYEAKDARIILKDYSFSRLEGFSILRNGPSIVLSNTNNSESVMIESMSVQPNDSLDNYINKEIEKLKENGFTISKTEDLIIKDMKFERVSIKSSDQSREPLTHFIYFSKKDDTKTVKRHIFNN